MAQDTQRDQIRRQRVVLTLPGMDGVTVRHESYRAGDANAAMDVYYPPSAREAQALPAVLLVTGFADAGAERMFGARFKDMGSFVSWAQLIAASGMIAITYANGEPADISVALQYVRDNAAPLRLDPSRIGIWACSGHGANALSVLIEHGRGLRCAALLYPYTMDLDGASRVAGAAAQFRFVTPAAGKSADDLPRDLPLCLLRAGRDQMPGLNAALDALVAASLARNLPVTVINHASGEHAFDLFDDSRTSRAIVTQVLTFLQLHLSTP
jgi:hypothetical protein